MISKALIGFFVFSVLSLANAGVGFAPVQHLYVPHGFDSNDSVEVIVTGYFPTPCYSRHTVNVAFRGDLIKIDVTALERPTRKGCPEMLVPFKEVVSVGNLKGGTYRVLVNNRLYDKLTIKEASSYAVDEHIYAAIDNLERKGPRDFVLHGWRYSHCIELDRVEVVSNGKDTFSVLPIMKQVSNFCPMKLTPVSFQVRLDTNSFRIKEKLIHVRTMDGKSFNSIIDL